MTTTQLRTAITGLLAFAAAEEETIFAAAVRGDSGGPRRWLAVPTLAHITEFKSQQSQRAMAILSGRTPPAFGEIDHTAESVYAAYATRPAEEVLSESRQVTASLIDAVRALADEDLLDPSRHSWLRGRTLWLQIIVRGFWHPTGHLGDYYIARDQPGRAVALQKQAVSLAGYLDAPDPARGMACYNLACAHARNGRPDDALDALSEAVARNAQLRGNAARDGDLRSLRDGGRLDLLLA